MIRFHVAENLSYCGVRSPLDSLPEQALIQNDDRVYTPIVVGNAGVQAGYGDGDDGQVYRIPPPSDLPSEENDWDD